MGKFYAPDVYTFEWQKSVKDKDLTAPPGSPIKGDRYIVAAGATGAWVGLSGKVVTYDGAGWIIADATPGMTTYVADETKFYLNEGGSWKILPDQAIKATTSNPTINDDGTQGYYIGFRWINTATDIAFICVDNSTGVAIWKDITATGDVHQGGDSFGALLSIGTNDVQSVALRTNGFDRFTISATGNVSTMNDLYTGIGATASTIYVRDANVTKAQISSSGDSYFIGGNVGIGVASPSAYSTLHVEKTSLVSTLATGILGRAIPNSNSTGAAYVIGVDATVAGYTIDSGFTNSDPGFIAGLRSRSYIEDVLSLGIITNQYGIYSLAGILTAGVGSVVTNSRAGYFKISNAVAGTTITNAYGVYIANSETTGTITNRFDLYCSSPNAKSYFAGKVGIGATNPSTELHIKAQSAGTRSAITLDDNLGRTLYISSPENVLNALIKTTTAQILELGAGNSSLLSLHNNGGVAIGNSYVTLSGGANSLIVAGNVGIGLTNPTVRLEVEEDTFSAKSLLKLTNTNLVGGGAPATLSLTSSVTNVQTGEKTGRIEFIASDSTPGIGVNAFIEIDNLINGTGEMTFATGAQGSAVEHVRIDSVGNFGINQANPTVKLDIFGGSVTNDDTARTALFDASQHNKIQVRTTSVTNHRASIELKSGTNTVSVDTSGGGDMNFNFNNTKSMQLDSTTLAVGKSFSGVIQVQDSSTPKIHLHSAGDSYFIGGNVGIGNTSPLAQFDVSGSIRTRDFYEYRNSLNQNAYYSLGWKRREVGYAHQISGGLEQKTRIYGTNTSTAGSAISWTAYFTIDKSVGYIGLKQDSPNSTVHVSGSYASGVTELSTSALTLDDTHYEIYVDASVGNVTITLPEATTTLVGREYKVIKVDSSANTVTVTRAGAVDVINSSLTKVISTQYDGLKLKCRNSGQWISHILNGA